MDPIDLAGLRPLMELTHGRPEIKIALIDGPVDVHHKGLDGAHIQPVGQRAGMACVDQASPQCRHGTFVAGILTGVRGGGAPAICPDCTLLVRPLFTETGVPGPPALQATPDRLASALRETLEAGAGVINLSVAALRMAGPGEQSLTQALDECARLGVVVVAAAGNEAMVGSSCITNHPWVIPVAAADTRGVPLGFSNLGNSISRRGVLAPGKDIASLAPGGLSTTLNGTSAAAPFVTGAIALLLSVLPGLRSRDARDAAVRAWVRRRSIVPPLLDAWSAYAELSARTERMRSWV